MRHLSSFYLVTLIAFTGTLSMACDPSKDEGISIHTPRPSDASMPTHEAKFPDGCNPLAHELDCLLPYPSDVFLTNGRLEITGAARMHTMAGDALDVAEMDSDGFALYPGILFKSARPISDETLKLVKTRLIHAQTLSEIPHIVEVFKDPDVPAQFIAIRPGIRLIESTRYIVTVSDLRDTDDAKIGAPKVFRALRDGDDLPDVSASMRRHYDEDIFPALEYVGVDRASLYLAWDFTTRSRRDAAGSMLTVRSKTLSWLDTHSVQLGDVSVHRADSGRPALVIRGTFDAPSFIDQDKPGARLMRNDQGEPIHEGIIKVPFQVHVPKAVLESGESANILQFGHGFFGNCGEVLSGVQVDFAEERGYVMGCVDWAGMTTEDGAHVLGLLAVEPERTFTFIHRVYQAMVNQLVFTSALKALAKTRDGQFENGLPMWSDNIQFLGISQGHILGGVIAALSPSFTRTVLHVGGGPFSLIMTRSIPFAVFDMMLRTSVAPEEALKFQLLAPTALEHIDPMTYAPFIIAEPLPGNPEKRILLQAVLGDTQVPNIASEAHAAAIGIPILQPVPRPSIFGGVTAAYPAESGLVYFDVGIPYDAADEWQKIPSQNRGHDGLRATPQARDQMDMFWKEGVIINPCEGPCIIEL